MANSNNKSDFNKAQEDELLKKLNSALEEENLKIQEGREFSENNSIEASKTDKKISKLKEEFEPEKQKNQKIKPNSDDEPAIQSNSISKDQEIEESQNEANISKNKEVNDELGSQIQNDFSDLKKDFKKLKKDLKNSNEINSKETIKKLEKFIDQTAELLSQNIDEPIEKDRVGKKQKNNQKTDLGEKDEIKSKAFGQGEEEKKPNKEKLSPLEEFLKKQKELVNRIEMYIMQKKAKEKEQKEKDIDSNHSFENSFLADLGKEFIEKYIDLYKNIKTAQDFLDALEKNIKQIESEEKDLDSDLKKFNLIQKKLFEGGELTKSDEKFLKNKMDDDFEKGDSLKEKIELYKNKINDLKTKFESLKENLSERRDEFSKMSQEEKENFIKKSFGGGIEKENDSLKNKLESKNQSLKENSSEKRDEFSKMNQEEKKNFMKKSFGGRGEKKNDFSKIQEMQKKLDEKPLHKVLNEQQNLNNIKSSQKLSSSEDKKDNSKWQESPSIELELKKLNIPEKDKEKMRKISSDFSVSLNQVEKLADQKIGKFEGKIISEVKSQSPSQSR